MVTPQNDSTNNPATTAEQEAADAQALPWWKSFLREWRGFFIFLAIMLLFRSILADWNHVPSGSMLPNILIGDRVVVNKLAYDLRVPFTFIRLAHFGDPQRGDIITFESPRDGRLLIKRVIGIPGDTVELRNNRLYLNGESADYSDIDAASAAETISRLDLANPAAYRICLLYTSPSPRDRG